MSKDKKYKKEKVMCFLGDRVVYEWREIVEENEKFKQIIPYITFVKLDNNKKRYALFQRVSKESDQRLFGKHTIGVGGHVKKDKENEMINFYINMLREIEEEIAINNQGVGFLQYIGLVDLVDNDDYKDPINKFHIGYLYTMTVNEKATIKNLEELNFIGWFTKDEILKKDFVLEDWTKFALNELL